MREKINAEALIGKRFERLIPQKIIPKYKNNRDYLECKCDCGNTVYVMAKHLIRGATKSCGCYRNEMRRAKGKNKTHGLTNSKEYHSWKGIKQRCCNPNDAGYSNYGGRGIKMCDRWLNSFEAFLEDMGSSPSPKHSIDRINVNGDYCPENCRWTTPKEQGDNKRNTNSLTVNGVTKTFHEWANHTGIPYTTIKNRTYAGWIPELIVSVPAKVITFKDYSFSEALNLMKQGIPLTRKAWEAEKRVVANENETLTKYLSNADGSIYTPTQEDMFAVDWCFASRE